MAPGVLSITDPVGNRRESTSAQISERQNTATITDPVGNRRGATPHSRTSFPLHLRLTTRKMANNRSRSGCTKFDAIVWKGLKPADNHDLSAQVMASTVETIAGQRSANEELAGPVPTCIGSL